MGDDIDILDIGITLRLSETHIRFSIINVFVRVLPRREVVINILRLKCTKVEEIENGK